MSNTVKTVPEDLKADFNRLARHPLQSWEWGNFRESQGHKIVRFGEFNKEKLITSWQISFHQIPHTPFTIGYLPKTKLPNRPVIDYLKIIGRENKAVFIKIEPQIESQNGQNSQIKRLVLFPGKPLFTKFTSVIDLTFSEEELLKSFKPKTRYNLRLAEKKGVKTKEDNSSKAFEKYLELLFETCQRQGFYAHSKKFHQDQWKILRSAGISHLLTATYRGKILATFLLFVFNHVLYYPYGASTREHKELMAPTLLMWEAIKFGKKQGCLSFDLWGDVEPDPSPTHPYYGFHKFKEGFSPKLIEFVGTYDLILNPVLYRVYKISDTLRWKFLRLKAKK